MAAPKASIPRRSGDCILFLRSLACLTIVIALTVSGCVRQGQRADDVPIPTSKPPASADRVEIPSPSPVAAVPPISTPAQVCDASSSVALNTRGGTFSRVLSWAFSPRTVLALSVEISGGGTGDVHMKMLNGDRYDFQAVGELIALKTQTGSLNIQVRQQPFGTSRTVSVTTALAMNVAGDSVGVYAGHPAPLRINHQAVAMQNPVIQLSHGGEIRREGKGFVIIWPSRSQVRILYGAYLDYIVTLCPPDQSQVGGLLGASDGKTGSNPTARDGSPVQLSGLEPEIFSRHLYHSFGDSWRITQDESLFDYANKETTKTFTDLTFPDQSDPLHYLTPTQRQNAETICRNARISDPALLRECVLDVGVTGVAAFAANDVLAEAIFARSGAAGPGDALRCKGQEGSGWECTVHNLSGASLRTSMILSVETLQSGKKGVESTNCGPVTESNDAPCRDKIHGRIFEGGQVIEVVTTDSGEQWQRKRPVRCGKGKGEPCG